MSAQTSDLTSLITRIEAAIGDPSAGLPEELFLFVTRLTPMVNVDLLIRNADDETLLTWRDDGNAYSYSPGWHIPGGIIRCKETSAERIAAVAAKELGTRVAFRADPLLVREVIHGEQRNRAHFVSFLFLCRLEAPLDESRRYRGGNPAPGQWAWHRTSPPDLISVHDPYRAFIDGRVPPFAFIAR